MVRGLLVSQRTINHMKLRLITAIVALAMPWGCGGERKDMTVSLLTTGRSSTIEGAVVEGESVWIPSEILFDILDVELVGDALCRGASCVAKPTADGWQRESGGRTLVELSSIAAALGQAVASEPDRRVWSLSTAPELDGSWRTTLRAPDIELPDRSGRLTRLSAFRGKKLLLLTWASW